MLETQFEEHGGPVVIGSAASRRRGFSLLSPNAYEAEPDGGGVLAGR